MIRRVYIYLFLKSLEKVLIWSRVI